MEIIFQSITISALWIWGVNCLFSKDHLLEKQGNWMRDYLPEWIYKPAVGCAACMSSIHGIIWFWIGLPICFNVHLPIIALIPFLMSLCGFNFVIIKLTTKERVIVDE